jgi:hypothetical protein
MALDSQQTERRLLGSEVLMISRLTGRREFMGAVVGDPAEPALPTELRVRRWALPTRADISTRC